MEMIYAAASLTFIPIGFTCIALATNFESSLKQDGFLVGGACLVVLGMVLLIGALRMAWLRGKLSELDRDELKSALSELIADLKGLRQDLKGGGSQNGRNKDSKI